jgi:hypothetical protein
LKQPVNISIINQGALSGVILVLLWYCSGYIIIFVPFLAKIFLFCILFYIWNTTSGIRALSLAENCGLIFFRVETYSGVLKLQRYVVTRINPRSGSNTRRKYKRYSSAYLLATLVTHVGTPLSGSASDNTYIRIDLDLLNPSIDKPICRLTAIVPPRKNSVRYSLVPG